MLRNSLFAALAAGVLLGGLGCRHRCNSPVFNREPRPFLPPPPGSVIGPPVGPRTNIPPPNLPTSPPSTLPPVGPSNSSPLPPGKETLFPDPLPGGPSSRSSSSPSNSSVLGAPAQPTTEPPLATPKAGTTAGLPGFTRVKDGLAAGGKPTLDGYDSLKQAGYRTVICLHAPGVDVASARAVAESRGLTFTAIETSPEKLADASARFERALNEQAVRPVYVYSDDALRAGALWYLHFRLVDLQSPDVAKIRAHSLGLSEAGDEAKAFWAAIQQYLATR